MVDQGENVRGQILALVREFVRREVAPQAAIHDRDDTYPHKLVKQMTELGLFGIAVPEEYGGLGLDHTTFAMIFEELSKGWMSITGVLGTHSILTYALARFGTTEQKRQWLPRLASGEMRGALAMTEPNAGSDVAAIRTVAVREGDEYVVNGRKLFITNGRHCHAALVMVKTDPDARPAHRGISALVVEKGPGFTVGPNMEKLGYRGVDTCELIFDNCRVPAENLVGLREGQGFRQVMEALEAGRINIAARAVGVATAAFEEAIRYAPASPRLWQAHRSTPGNPDDAGGHGDEDSRRPPADVRRRGQEGPGRALRRGGGDGQAICQRNVRRGDAGCHAHSRRLRVREGLASGAVLPGRSTHDYRGGHQRNSEACHRP